MSLDSDTVSYMDEDPHINDDKDIENIQRLLLKKQIREEVKEEFDNERRLWKVQRSQERFEIFAKWIKEIALLIFAAFVLPQVAPPCLRSAGQYADHLFSSGSITTLNTYVVIVPSLIGM